MHYFMKAAQINPKQTSYIHNLPVLTMTYHVTHANLLQFPAQICPSVTATRKREIEIASSQLLSTLNTSCIQTSKWLRELSLARKWPAHLVTTFFTLYNNAYIFIIQIYSVFITPPVSFLSLSFYTRANPIPF